MNAKTLAELALKIWGVTLLIGSLASLPVTLLMSVASPGNDSQAALIRASQIGSILHFVIQALVGVAVIVWADNITNLIESDVTPLRVDTSTAEFQALGFALVGVFVLVEGIQNVAATAYVWFSRPSFDQTEPLSYLWTRQNEAIGRALVQVVAGALLVFGRDAIVHGWSRLRGQPMNDADSENGDQPESR
jgi:hypothetical protein